MATEIAEPQELPSGSITDETAYRYKILVYEQAQENAGIKVLAIGDWKNYLQFNMHEANNIATFIGIDENEYNYKQNADAPLPAGVNSVLDRIQAVADQAGVTTTPTSGVPSLNSRINTLEDYVKDGWTDESTTPATPYDGLLNRVKTAEANIESIEEEIGSGGSGGSSSLTGRVTALETTVGNSSSGLVKSVSDLQTTVGDTNSGLVKTVGDADSGLVKDVADLQTAVGDSTSGLTKDVADLESAVGDASSGLTKQVNTNTSDINTLKGQVSSIMSFKGNITGQEPNAGALIIDGNPTEWDDITHGFTYNINPSASGDTFVISYPTGYGPTGSGSETLSVKRGDNITFVKPNSQGGYFDVLGSTIDISSITDDVNELKSKFNETQTTSDNRWSSDSLEDGTYIVTAKVPQTGGSSSIAAVIIRKSSGNYSKPVPIDSTLYEAAFDENSITLAITAKAAIDSQTVNAIRIGA